MAQLVEQLTRNEQVTGSSPVNGSMNSQRPASQRAFSYLRLVAAYSAGVSLPALLSKKRQPQFPKATPPRAFCSTAPTPAGVSAVVSTLLKEHQFRGNRAQVELWAKNSGEAITWIFDLAQKVGAQVSDTTKKWTSTVQTVNDYPMSYLSIDFGPKPYNTGDGMRALANYAEDQGVDIFYSTEAKQLVGDADSGITGVIAKGADGSIQFTAK